MTSPTHLIPCPTATYLQVHWNFHNNNNNNNDPIPHTRAPAPSQLQSSPPQPPPPPKMGSYEIGTKKPTRVDEELQNTQFHNNPPQNRQKQNGTKAKDKRKPIPRKQKKKGRELKAHQKERKPTKAWIFDEYGSFDHLQ
jgi:hypothetical protein